jgi:hypothetical protein
MTEIIQHPYFSIAIAALALTFFEVRCLTLTGREFFYHIAVHLTLALCRKKGLHVIPIPLRLQTMIMGGGLKEDCVLYVEEGIPMIADPDRIVISKKEAKTKPGTVFSIKSIGKRTIRMKTLEHT